MLSIEIFKYVRIAISEFISFIVMIGGFAAVIYFCCIWPHRKSFRQFRTDDKVPCTVDYSSKEFSEYRSRILKDSKDNYLKDVRLTEDEVIKLWEQSKQDSSEFANLKANRLSELQEQKIREEYAKIAQRKAEHELYERLAQKEYEEYRAANPRTNYSTPSNYEDKEIKPVVGGGYRDKYGNCYLDSLGQTAIPNIVQSRK